MDSLVERTTSRPSLTAPLRLLLVSEPSFLSKALAAGLRRDHSVASVQCVDAAEIGSTSADRVDAFLVYADRPEDVMIARRLLDAMPGATVIGCGLADNPASFISWIAAGAAGYIPKTTCLAQFVPRLRGILDAVTQAAAAMAQPAARSPVVMQWN